MTHYCTNTKRLRTTHGAKHSFYLQLCKHLVDCHWRLSLTHAASNKEVCLNLRTSRPGHAESVEWSTGFDTNTSYDSVLCVVARATFASGTFGVSRFKISVSLLKSWARLSIAHPFRTSVWCVYAFVAGGWVSGGRRRQNTLLVAGLVVVGG